MLSPGEVAACMPFAMLDTIRVLSFVRIKHLPTLVVTQNRVVIYPILSLMCFILFLCTLPDGEGQSFGPLWAGSAQFVAVYPVSAYQYGQDQRNPS